MNPQKTFTVDEAQKKLESFCAYQERCHKEVRLKLKDMKMIPQAIDKIIVHLIEHNFLNEERFAKSFARGKFRIKKWGKDRIVRELKFRDISAYNIKSALKEIDEELYVKTIEKIAASKKITIKESNLFKKKKKIYDYLYRKGYESSLIQETIQKLFK